MTAKMKSVFTARVAFGLWLLVSLVLIPQVVAAGQQQVFKTVEAASGALIQAAKDGDAAAMMEIFGPDGIDLVKTGDPVLDRNQAAEFAAEARIKTQLVWNPEQPEIVTLEVGADDWPLPIPIVKKDGKWRFDTEAGRQEMLYRRIGRNELLAIEICRGFVEAQYDYAQTKHGDSRINQYAQTIISTPGTRDGLAWQTEDGTWEGPVGEAAARVIAEGYTERYTPYHGYYFKVLTGQGSAAPMGEMDFVVDDVMIGGFALAAAPSDYEVTGVMTFIVSHNGIVYQKDLGPESVELFRSMELYNPDDTWSPVPAQPPSSQYHPPAQ